MVHEGRILVIAHWVSEYGGLFPEHVKYVLAMVTHYWTKEWLLPVLKVLELCGYERLKFIAAIKN